MSAECHKMANGCSDIIFCSFLQFLRVCCEVLYCIGIYPLLNIIVSASACLPTATGLLELMWKSYLWCLFSLWASQKKGGGRERFFSSFFQFFDSYVSCARYCTHGNFVVLFGYRHCTLFLFLQHCALLLPHCTRCLLLPWLGIWVCTKLIWCKIHLARAGLPVCVRDV